MAVYKRLVTYLYLCQKHTTPKNIGFAKVVVAEETCQIEIHLRYQQELPVYIFTRQEDSIQGIYIGDTQTKQMNSFFKKTFLNENIVESGLGLEDMAGFILPIDDENMIAGQWDRKDVVRQQFKIWEPPQLREEQTEDNEYLQSKERQRFQKGEVHQSQKSEDQQFRKGEVHQSQKGEDQQFWKGEVHQSQKSEDIQVEGIPQEETGEHMEHSEEQQNMKMQQIAAAVQINEWQGSWENILDHGEIFAPMEGEDAIGVRMELNDLHALPKQLWAIGNNSFLLHGFFNYRFILVGKLQKEGKMQYFIGVPGVFSNQESVIASLFGFPEFYSEKITETKTGQPGYWCCFYAG